MGFPNVPPNQPRSPRQTPVRLLLLAALLLPAEARAAARVGGYLDCEKCHKPAIKEWKVDEPSRQGGKAHYATLKQLADPKSRGFAAAIGLADPMSPRGRCMECHGTVVRGRARYGVSCESCHGPDSGYLTVHDKEPYRETYKKSIPLGLRDLHGKVDAIAELCVSCHVTPEKALAAAGHPSGAKFDAGASLQKIVHWTAAFTPDGKPHASYDYAKVTAAAKPLVARALASGGAGSRRASAPASSAPAAAASVLGDWAHPVALPDNYTAPPAPAAGGGAPAPRPAVAAASGAEDQPLPVELPETPAMPAAPSAPSALGEAVDLRNRGGDLLARLLDAGRHAPDLAEPKKPQEFQGPDSELLHLQDVILYLALETLRRPKS